MEFSETRWRYLGLWKVAAMTSADQASASQRTFKADFRVGLKPEIGGAGEMTKFPRPELVLDPAFLRSRARDIIPRVSRSATEIQSGVEIEGGEWCRIAGRCRAVHVFHDDFRAVPDAPSLVAWLFEVPDLDADSVTWFVLHGTPGENEVERMTAKMPATRSGSGSEALFEVLYAAAYEGRLEDVRRRVREYRPEALSLAVSGLFNDYSSYTSETVESLFRVTEVLLPGSLDRNSEQAVVSMHGLSAKSQGNKEAVVSRVVIGGPLIVQTYRSPQRQNVFRRMWAHLRGRSITKRFDSPSAGSALPQSDGPRRTLER
ncbi:hypothetical protein [Curtobacterium flaccumfaciens]|uniref:hypothetical protein n=1 Tax=Curtobacterium flaccumfaciens TaxID=2035 RepID=UPI003879EF86